MNCCHKNCVGGCLNETAASCVGCLRTHLGACVDKCPPGTYDTNDRWCLNETTCAEENGFILGDKCLEDCPAGYANESNFCVYCGDYCFSSCSGREISREEHLEYFKGCTVINGSLKIIIRGGSSVMEALERGLSSVRIITGYLKIFHVTALVNLKFLNKLEVILGTKLLYDRYAIAILGNRDLEQLWEPEGEPLKYSKLVRNEFEKDFKELISLDGSNQMNNKIKIGRGQVMLHYNGKLCLHVIENFVQLLGYNFSTISDIDVSRVSNGDLNSCDKISINVTVKSVEEHLVKLLWNHEKFRDTRQHLGYKIYYKKIKENETITSYSMTDACAHDSKKHGDTEAQTSLYGHPTLTK
ncbi:hypothetical protein HELRODRAFT_161365 [Helobdella robusta]|uniref:receptor protein-tyrosine kinase n=1 Tax=Helobdella robusta TaxID=6412 RepID=T1ERE5_HELRO|nr:hypothetical protein HELRODRAFT_161365 [Helobdella robusta]ESO02129.1 hypothetical protein HELRODRAFT_161365 [Helobdella robusta]